MNLKQLIEAMSGTEFYDKLNDPNFKYESLFQVKIPLEFINPNKNIKTDLLLKVPINMKRLDRYVESYIKTSADLKKKYDSYAYWYNNFNKLIFDSLEESDACLFLAACAFTSANTALDQNILEGAKLFSAVLDDYGRGPEGIKDLQYIIANVKENNTNDSIAKLKSLVDRGSYYAALLAPKKDYKGGVVMQGARKGQNDVFSEITVSNAKIPNFNMFVKYYLDRNGQVTKEQVMADIRNGTIKVGGTKINSFMMNLIDPDYKWKSDEGISVSPATIDRWMIRVFFHEPLVDIVDELIDADIIVTDDKTAKIKPDDKKDVVVQKKEKAVGLRRDKILGILIMDLFSNDTVRQNIVRILNKESEKMGLNAQQLQALSWVQVREEFGEPKAKFAKFEDVMDFAKETTKKIFELNQDLDFIKAVGEPMKGKFNDAIRTIRILAKSPRFKFKNAQDVTDTIENRAAYEKVYYLPPKEVSRAKNPELWLQTRIALQDEKATSVSMVGDRHADIFILSKSKKKPVHRVTGKDKKSTLKAAVRWILANV
jgi:hypothetical protein